MAANQIQQQQKGMKAEAYRAAMSGSFEDIPNWKEQETPTKNNILHIHVGKKSLIDIEFLKKVLNENDGYSLLRNKPNSNGCTPLHLAARLGHEIAIELFLERASNVDGVEMTKLMEMTNKKKDTALHEAARAGNDTVVELLVSKDPNCAHHEPNEDGETPLYLAAERGSTTSVLTILEKCNAPPLAYHRKGPCGRTVLHAAVQWGEPEMVLKIVEKKKSLIRIQNNEGLTPIHCAAAELQKVALLKILLEEDLSAVYIRDNIGRTPLHIAMLRKNWKAIESLLELCPDCIEIVDNEGQNVLHYAAKWTCVEIMKEILRHPNVDKLINEKDIDGNAPFHILAASVSDTPLLHTCLYDSLRNLIKDMPSLDLKAFNKQNRTVGDIMLSLASLLRREHKLEVYSNNNRGRRINTYEGDFDVERATSGNQIDTSAESAKKAGKSQMVVAALIATVSFTAGFTIPGGFDQNPGKTMGMAVLSNNQLFKLFLFSDVISFITSIFAIVNYFALTLGQAKLDIRFVSLTARLMTTISLAALVLAFIAGVSAVLPPQSSGLAPFIFCFIILLLISWQCAAVFMAGRPTLIKQCNAFKIDRRHV